MTIRMTVDNKYPFKYTIHLYMDTKFDGNMVTTTEVIEWVRDTFGRSYPNNPAGVWQSGIGSISFKYEEHANWFLLKFSGNEVVYD